jgi:entericidin A
MPCAEKHQEPENDFFKSNNEENYMFMNARFFMLMSLAVIGLGVSACETIGGAGRDIENAGEAVQKGAS